LDLKVGAFLAILGYGTAALLGFLKSAEKKNVELVKTVQKSTDQEKPQPPNDTFAQIEKLNDLRQKGILTEEEFNNKKVELLAKL